MSTDNLHDFQISLAAFRKVHRSHSFFAFASSKLNQKASRLARTASGTADEATRFSLNSTGASSRAGTNHVLNPANRNLEAVLARKFCPAP